MRLSNLKYFMMKSVKKTRTFDEGKREIWCIWLNIYLLSSVNPMPTKNMNFSVHIAFITADEILRERKKYWLMIYMITTKVKIRLVIAKNTLKWSNQLMDLLQWFYYYTRLSSLSVCSWYAWKWTLISRRSDDK